MKKTGTIIGLLIVLGIAAIALALAFSSPGSADPTGASYVMPTGKETITDVATMANKAYYGANFTWIMITGFMVFFFQCGFAMVETGFCRGKNAAHTMTMNFMVFLVGAVGYFLVGFALQFGGSGGAAGLGTGGAHLMPCCQYQELVAFWVIKDFYYQVMVSMILVSMHYFSSRWYLWIPPLRFQPVLLQNE